LLGNLIKGYVVDLNKGFNSIVLEDQLKKLGKNDCIIK